MLSLTIKTHADMARSTLPSAKQESLCLKAKRTHIRVENMLRSQEHRAATSETLAAVTAVNPKSPVVVAATHASQGAAGESPIKPEGIDYAHAN